MDNLASTRNTRRPRREPGTDYTSAQPDATGPFMVTLLDVGPDENGDVVLCQFGKKSILIDGAHPGHNDDSDDDEEIIAVEPEAANHPWDRSARPKAVVVKNKKVIGMQG